MSETQTESKEAKMAAALEEILMLADGAVGNVWLDVFDLEARLKQIREIAETATV